MEDENSSTLNRRDFITGMISAGGFVLLNQSIALAGTQIANKVSGLFLTPHEKFILGLACDKVFTEATQLGSVDFIETLLTAFDGSSTEIPPKIYAQGPFSGSTPFPPSEESGRANKFPPNDFEKFLPLTREQTISWKLKLYGPSALGGWHNNQVVEKEFQVFGLRDLIRFGIHYNSNFISPPCNAEWFFVKPGLKFDNPDFNDQKWLNKNYDLLAGNYVAAIQELTLQSCFCSPVYGGNKDRIGWTLVRYPGDRSPQGYSTWNPHTQSYMENPQFPVSTADLEDGMPLEGWVRSYISIIELALKLGLR